jgi:hypothetical protein
MAEGIVANNVETSPDVMRNYRRSAAFIRNVLDVDIGHMRENARSPDGSRCRCRRSVVERPRPRFRERDVFFTNAPVWMDGPTAP